MSSYERMHSSLVTRTVVCALNIIMFHYTVERALPSLSVFSPGFCRDASQVFARAKGLSNIENNGDMHTIKFYYEALFFNHKNHATSTCFDVIFSLFTATSVNHAYL